MTISGIITTNLGETVTIIEVAGRERRIHHSKSLPLLLTGERFFFVTSSFYKRCYRLALCWIMALPCDFSD